MNKALAIYIDRLKKEESLAISERVPSTALDLSDDELSFGEEVEVEGEAYLAGERLILRLTLRATAFLPCCICNELVPLAIDIPDLYRTHPLEEIAGSLFDYSQEVREELLLALPLFAECEGECPMRALLTPFLKNEEKP